MIERNGALILSVNDPNPILTAIPRAKHIRFKGKYLVIVPHRLEETQVLQNLGLKPPSPIRTQYNWPGRNTPWDNQIATAEFATLNRRCFILNEMRCVDANTEYLSPTGWKKISEYDGGQVAQYNRSTKVSTFVLPTEYIKKPCPEDMIRFKTTKGVDQLVTENHRVLYVTSTGNTMVRSAGEIEAANLKTIRGWKGRFITTFKMHPNTQLGLSDTDLRVMVASIADGYFGNATTRCVVRLKKQRKIDRLHSLLAQAGIEYDCHYQDYTGFWVFKYYAPRREKDFSNYWAASKNQLEIIVDEVFHWDGSERTAGASDFSTFVKESADFIQYACASCGRTAALHTYTRDRGRGLETEYVVHAREGSALLYVAAAKSDGTKINNISREPSPDGYCYCFTVPDTFLVMRRNGCVFITGNTGKTASTLWAADYLLLNNVIEEVLVICPLTVAAVWDKQIFDVVPHRSTELMLGDRTKRIRILNDKASIKIINFDGVLSIVEDMVKYYKDKRVLIIVDEASTYRTPGTKRYKALKKLITPLAWLWMLTGTPTPNSPTDAWALAKLINPKNVPSSFKLFQEMLMRPAGPYKWIPKPGAHQMAFDALQPGIRFLRKDCFEIPEVSYEDRPVEMSGAQRIAFENLKKKMRYEDKEAGISISAANAAVRLIKFQQIFCGVVKDDEGNLVYLDSSMRMEMVEELVKEAGGKVIIFAPFIASMHQIVDRLSKKYKVGLVNGEVARAERAEIFKEFQHGSNVEILVAHPKVASLGLELSAASTIIWYAPIYSLEQYEQANMRILDSAQKDKCAIYHIACHPVEWNIYQVLRTHSTLQNSLLNLYQELLDS